MFRAYVIILILSVGLIFQRCATLEHFDGSSKEERKTFKMTKGEMWDEIEKLKAQNVDLQVQVNILRKEEQRIRDENENKMARMRDENVVLNEQINQLREENQRINDENQVLGKKLAGLQPKYDTVSSESYELEKDVRELKIKVLSGDGNLTSAKEMAKKLRNMGYKIRLIHYAPRSSFSYNTVYYTPKFQSEATRLGSSLGANTILKPLTWPSVFDIIVVTGKSP